MHTMPRVSKGTPGSRTKAITGGRRRTGGEQGIRKRKGRPEKKAQTIHLPPYTLSRSVVPLWVRALESGRPLIPLHNGRHRLSKDATRILYSCIEPHAVRIHNNVTRVVTSLPGRNPCTSRQQVELLAGRSNTNRDRRFSRCMSKGCFPANPHAIPSLLSRDGIATPGIWPLASRDASDAGDVTGKEKTALPSAPADTHVFKGSSLTFKGKGIFTGMGDFTLGHYNAIMEFYDIMRRLKVPHDADKSIESYSISNMVTAGHFRWQADIDRCAADHPWAIRANFPAVACNHPDWSVRPNVFASGSFTFAGCRSINQLVQHIIWLIEVMQPYFIKDGMHPGYHSINAKTSLQEVHEKELSNHFLFTVDDLRYHGLLQ